MYESPINTIYDEITHKILKNEEDNIMLEVQQAVGYAVDKDELIKALLYDRNQYEKGFNDARPKAKWIPKNADFIWWKCSKCGQVIFSASIEDILEFHKFCGRCGAEMKIESEISKC